MISSVSPAAVVLYLFPRSSGISASINGHGRWKEVILLSIELVTGYSSLLLFIARLVVMCTTVLDERGEDEKEEGEPKGGRERERVRVRRVLLNILIMPYQVPMCKTLGALTTSTLSGLPRQAVPSVFKDQSQL